MIVPVQKTPRGMKLSPLWATSDDDLRKDRPFGDCQFCYRVEQTHETRLAICGTHTNRTSMFLNRRYWTCRGHGGVL
jgi:hypothetical protein